MVKFATAVVLQRPELPGGRPWTDLKELVATSSDIWESSTEPTVQ